MSKDKDYNAMIHSKRWTELRRRLLSVRPLCESCGRRGIVTAASEAHHIRPVEEARTPAAKERRMFDPSNLAALCHSCHVEAHKAMGRTGRAAARRINAAKAADFERAFYGISVEK